MTKMHLASIALPALCLLVYSPTCRMIVFFILVTFFSALTGISIAIYIHILLSSRHQTGTPEKLLHHLEHFHKTVLKQESKPNHLNTNHLPVVFGRTVDGLLQQLLDLILRDFLIVYLKTLAYDVNALVDNFREDLWGAVQNLHDRMCRIDAAKLIAVDMVTRVTMHFEKIRMAKSSVVETGRPPALAVMSHLRNQETELQYLRKVSEMCIMFLLPRGYSLAPAKYLIREVLACKILYPAISIMTSPDYINQKILDYLETQQQAKALRQQAYEYAATFEDFIKMINTCTDVDKLKGLRYHIVTEIMQATTMQNLQRAKGVDPDQEKSGGASKSDMLAARKIKRYIAQLSYAKTQCEKNLGKLGWEGGFPAQDENKALLLPEILETVWGRKHLGSFLETVASSGLLGFYMAVEELRTAHRSSWHQLGAEIFYTYIRAPSAEVKVDKEVRKRMEAFLLGDKGPEVFYEVQRSVFTTLEEKYYQSFLLSEQYRQLKQALATEDQTQNKDSGSLDEIQSDITSDTVDGALHVGDHSNYARKKLSQLQERLNNKTQALQALRSSLKPESRVLSILEKEVEWLKGEQRQLEAHLTRTETWGENLGKWRAVVQSAEVLDERSPPQFVLVVQMSEGEGEESEGICTGWVVLRTLTNFQELHRKLRPLCSEIKSIELPSNTFKFLFGKNDKSSLEKAKLQIQKYLEFVLEDDRLNQCEALYAFLSPSSEHLKLAMPSAKKSRFSFSTLFKSGSGDTQRSSGEIAGYPPPREEEEISMYLDGAENSSNTQQKLNSDDGKDTIAEPMYALLGEVFDMKGVFKWLRRSLISFVQVTYGRTINRQIRDTISYLSSEPMLHYYATHVIKCWWPGGLLAQSQPCDNSKQGQAHQEQIAKLKQAQRALAGALLVDNVPQVLTSLVGARTAKRGAAKVFDTIQNEMANKQLFYELFELLIIEVFPELKQHQ